MTDEAQNPAVRVGDEVFCWPVDSEPWGYYIGTVTDFTKDGITVVKCFGVGLVQAHRVERLLKF
jgi:hypothetical protein